MRECVHLGRLFGTRQYETPAPMRLEVSRRGFHPRMRRLREKLGRQFPEGALTHGQAYVRHRSGDGWSGFRDVKSIHLPGTVCRRSAARKIMRVPDLRRPRAQEIRSEGNDHVRLVEVVDTLDRFT